MNTREAYIELITVSLENLAVAIVSMLQDTTPRTALPRPKMFRFGDFMWPRRAEGGLDLCSLAQFDAAAGRWYILTLCWPRDQQVGGFEIADGISWLGLSVINATGYSPRRVQQFVRGTRDCAAWCYAMAEGRQWAALNIVQGANNERRE